MKTIVMIPTFNERENIEKLINKITSLENKDLHVMVVDDNSPDGTGQIVENMSKMNPKIQVLHRKKRRGRGSAGIDGFKHALAQGADYIIEMDGDFSHNPMYIPELLSKIKDCDVVIGSRFVQGGKDNQRGYLRQTMTYLAGIYVHTLLQIQIRDVSSGYRCFRREALETIDLENMVSTGPSVVLELLYKLCLKSCKIVEIPIVFEDRRQGRTKLDYLTLLETLLMVLRLRKLKKEGLL